jgi:hypothetical protein
MVYANRLHVINELVFDMDFPFSVGIRKDNNKFLSPVPSAKIGWLFQAVVDDFCHLLEVLITLIMAVMKDDKQNKNSDTGMAELIPTWLKMIGKILILGISRMLTLMPPIISPTWYFCFTWQLRQLFSMVKGAINL